MADEKTVVEIRVVGDSKHGAAIANVVEQAFRAQRIEVENTHPEAEAMNQRTEVTFAQSTMEMRGDVKIKIVP